MYPEVDFGGSYVSGRKVSMGGKGKKYMSYASDSSAFSFISSKTSSSDISLSTSQAVNESSTIRYISLSFAFI